MRFVFAILIALLVSSACYGQYYVYPLPVAQEVQILDVPAGAVVTSAPVVVRGPVFGPVWRTGPVVAGPVVVGPRGRIRGVAAPVAAVPAAPTVIRTGLFGRRLIIW